MKVFKHPNLSNNWHCPICKTKKDKEVVLVGIQGTENGYNIEATQYHLDCIDLIESRLLNGNKILISQEIFIGDLE